MKTKKLKYIIQCALILSLVGLGTSRTGVADEDHHNSPAVFPRDAVVFGRTYADWSAAWYQWVSSMPATANPLFDTVD